MRPKFKPPEMIRNTWVLVKGEPQDVDVEFDWDDGVELCAVWFEDEGSILGDMTEADIKEAEQRLTEEVNTMAAEWAEEYAEWLYEQRRDGD